MSIHIGMKEHGAKEIGGYYENHQEYVWGKTTPVPQG